MYSNVNSNHESVDEHDSTNEHTQTTIETICTKNKMQDLRDNYCMKAEGEYVTLYHSSDLSKELHRIKFDIAIHTKDGHDFEFTKVFENSTSFSTALETDIKFQAQHEFGIPLYNLTSQMLIQIPTTNHHQDFYNISVDVLELTPVFYIHLQFDNFLVKTNVTSVAMQIEIMSAGKSKATKKMLGLYQSYKVGNELEVQAIEGVGLENKKFQQHPEKSHCSALDYIIGHEFTAVSQCFKFSDEIHNEYKHLTSQDFMAQICTGQLCSVKVKDTEINFLFVVFTVFLLVMFGIFSTKISDFTGISQSLLLLIAGLCIGVQISGQTSFGDNIDPKTVLWILLPALLFESGIDTDYHIFENLFGQIILLAVPGVVFCAFLNGQIMLLLGFDKQFDFSTAEQSFLACVILGTILSATDPVAVVSLFKKLGTDKRISTLIEGESLLNDGSAVVLLDLMLHIVVGLIQAQSLHGGHSSSALDLVWIGLRLFFLSPLFGYYQAYFVRVVSSKQSNPLQQALIVFFNVQIMFQICEHQLGMSGVLATVTQGIYYSNIGALFLSHDGFHLLHNLTGIVAFMSDTLIFLLSGVIMGEFFMKSVDDWQVMVSNLLMLQLVLIFVRAFMLVCFYPILLQTGYNFDFKRQVLLNWSALRGAVGLCGALIVCGEIELPFAYQKQVLFYTSGVVILTILINGSTTSWIMDAVGLNALTIEQVKNKLELCSNTNQILLEQDTNKSINSLSKLIVKNIGLAGIVNESLGKIRHTVLYNKAEDAKQNEDQEDLNEEDQQTNLDNADYSSYTIQELDNLTESHMHHFHGKLRKLTQDETFQFKTLRMSQYKAVKAEQHHLQENYEISRQNFMILMNSVDQAVDVNDSNPDDNDGSKIQDRLTNRNLRALGIGYIIAWINTTFYKEAQETEKQLKLQLIENYLRAHNHSLKQVLEYHQTSLEEYPDSNIRNLLLPLGINLDIKINNMIQKNKKKQKRRNTRSLADNDRDSDTSSVNQNDPTNDKTNDNNSSTNKQDYGEDNGCNQILNMIEHHSQNIAIIQGLKDKFGDVQLKEFFGAYAHATNLIKKLQKNVDSMHIAGILEDQEKNELTNTLQLKRQTLYETVHDLTQEQLEDAHIETLSLDLFGITNEEAEQARKYILRPVKVLAGEEFTLDGLYYLQKGTATLNASGFTLKSQPLHYGRLVGALSTSIAATQVTESSTKLTQQSNTTYNLTAIKDCELYKVTHNDLIHLMIDTQTIRYNFVRLWIQNKCLEKIKANTNKIIEVKSVGLSEKALNQFLAMQAIEYLLELSSTKHEEWNAFILRELEQQEFIDTKESHFQLVKERLLNLIAKEQISIKLLNDKEDIRIKPGNNLVVLGKGMCVNTLASAKDYFARHHFNKFWGIVDCKMDGLKIVAEPNSQLILISGRNLFLKELNKFNQKIVQKAGSKHAKNSMLHLMVIEDEEDMPCKSRAVSRKRSVDAEIVHNADESKDI